MQQKLRQDISIGNTLRQMRLDKGYSQNQVIARMQLMGFNISRSIYSQMEQGTYNIRISELAALKEIYGVDYADFFKGVDISNYHLA